MKVLLFFFCAYTFLFLYCDRGSARLQKCIGIRPQVNCLLRAVWLQSPMLREAYTCLEYTLHGSTVSNNPHSSIGEIA